MSASDARPTSLLKGKADIAAKLLTRDEARRIAANIAKPAGAAPAMRRVARGSCRVRAKNAINALLLTTSLTTVVPVTEETAAAATR